MTKEEITTKKMNEAFQRHGVALYATWDGQTLVFHKRDIGSEP